MTATSKGIERFLILTEFEDFFKAHDAINKLGISGNNPVCLYVGGSLMRINSPAEPCGNDRSNFFRSEQKSMRIYFKRSIVIPCRRWVIESIRRKGEKSCQLTMENVRFYLLKSDARHAYTLNACYTRCPFLLSADFIQFRFT